MLAHVERVPPYISRWDGIKESRVWGGNQHPSLRKDAQLCCGQDNDTGCAAKATSKVGSSEANYEEKSQILLHSCGTAISNNSIQIIFLLLRVKATLPT